MKTLIFFLLIISTGAFAQNELDLLKLKREGKLNLVPRYGLIENSDKIKKADNEFIERAIGMTGSKDSASQYFGEQGFSLFYKGDIRTAMKRFNQAWLIDSSNALPYFGFSSVLTVISDNPSYYYGLKSVEKSDLENPDKYWKIGKRKDFNRKNEQFALYFIATGYEKYGKIDEAIESCNLLLNQIPNDTNILYQLGHLYVVDKQFKKGIENINKAFPNGSNNIYALNDLGFAYSQINNFEAAKRSYDKAISINPEYLNAIYSNAVIHYEAEKYDLAIDYIEKCIKIKNDVGQFYKTKGDILLKLNDKKKAIKSLKKAKKLGDKEAKALLKEID